MEELLLSLKEKYQISDEDAQKVVEALMEREKRKNSESKAARRSRGLFGELFDVTETLLGAGVKSSAQMMGIMTDLLDSGARGSAEMLGIINDVLDSARRDESDEDETADKPTPE
jgi:hypothetical protein